MKLKIDNFSTGVRADKSEGVLNISVADTISNLKIENGSIRVVSDMAVNQTITNLLSGKSLVGASIFIYKRYDEGLKKYENILLFFDADHVGYYYKFGGEDTELTPLGLTFKATPMALNYRLNGKDVIIISSSKDCMVVWDSVNPPEMILDAPKPKSMVIHYERLFSVSAGGDETEIKFSDDLDPTNWSESVADAGFISLVDERGKLLKLVSFNDYLYVFREHGISRVYANTALTTSFYVNHLFVSGGRVLENTIMLAGDRVIFLATDGFYYFDGGDTRKILTNIFDKIRFTGKECAGFFNGKYYLACNFNFGDEFDGKNNCVIAVRVSDLSVEILRFGEVADFATITTDTETKLLVLTTNPDKAVIDISSTKNASPMVLNGEFKSVLYDFDNIDEVKTIRYIKTDSVGVGTIGLYNENGEMVSFDTADTNKKVGLLFSGRKIGLIVGSADKDFKLISIVLGGN